MSISVPSVWKTVREGEHSARFEHERYSLNVKIEPRYRSSTHQKRGAREVPRSYRVTLAQDWFSKGLLGDQSVAAKAETYDEAREIAQRYMQRFDRSRASIERERGDVYEESFDHDEVKEHLTTEASAVALSESIPYSDDLLREVLEEAVGDHLRLIAHRDRSTLEIVYTRDDVEMSTNELKRRLGQLSVDLLGLDATVDGSDHYYLELQIADFRVCRFIAGVARETVVVLDYECPVESPTFEQSIASTLAGKWA